MEAILHQLIGSLSLYAIIYKVLYIPGGAGFLPSTVSLPSVCVLKHGNEFPQITPLRTDEFSPQRLSNGNGNNLDMTFL